MEETTFPAAQEIGVTFGTVCKYGREVLRAINDQASTKRKREIAQGNSNSGEEREGNKGEVDLDEL